VVGNDERLLVESGFIEFQSGRVDNAFADWHRAAQRAPQEQLAQIIVYAAQVPTLSNELEKLLPDDPTRIVDLVKNYFAASEAQPTRERMLKQAQRLLSRSKPTPQRHYLDGMVFALRDDNSAAIGPLTAAVELCPDELDWRYELAVLLQKTGNVDAAHEQARWCWSREPSNERYERLFRQLVRLQLTTR
jgi:hypothetical protein